MSSQKTLEPLSEKGRGKEARPRDQWMEKSGRWNQGGNAVQLAAGGGNTGKLPNLKRIWVRSHGGKKKVRKKKKCKEGMGDWRK